MYQYKIKDLEGRIRNIPDGQAMPFNTVHEGGALVVKVCSCLYRLYEIPLYGGEPVYVGSYGDTEIFSMIDEALSWA